MPVREQDPEIVTRHFFRESPQEENGIDLIQCIEIITKRKIIVLAVFIVSMLFPIWNFLAPRVYEVSMVIEPPTMLIEPTVGAITGGVDLDSVGNLRGKIESGAFTARIVKELDIPEKFFQLDVSQPKDTKLVRVSTRQPARKTDIGRNALIKLFEALKSNYAQVIESKQNRIENKIKIVLSQIGTKENEMRLMNEQVKITTNRERQLIEELKETKTNSEKLLIKREALFDQKQNRDDISSLLYTTTIQQNIGYFTQLQNALSELKSKRENLLNSISNLKNGIAE